jgi:hypothetical protein
MSRFSVASFSCGRVEAADEREEVEDVEELRVAA